MRKITFFLIITAFSFSAKAQINPSSVVAGVQSDINYLADGYLSPFGAAMNISMNNGWYNTAETKKLGRFELGISPMVLFVPSDFQSFKIDPAQLQELELVDPNDDVTPTVFGNNKPGVELEYSNPNIPAGLANRRFNMPSGSGLSFMPMMTFQVGVGLVYDTDVKFRYLPEISFNLGDDLGKGDLSMFGAAINHNFKQWIPGFNKLPFDASIFFGFTNFNYSQNIGDEGDDKAMVMTTNTYTTRLLVSKELLFITFYGGLGYNGGDTRIQLNGSYDYIDPTDLQNPQKSIEDPVDFTTTAGNGFTGNLGIRAKFLWVVYFSADYTFGVYNAATAGFGVSVDF